VRSFSGKSLQREETVIMGNYEFLKLHLEGSKNRTQRWSNQQKQLYSLSDTPLIVTVMKISVV